MRTHTSKLRKMDISVVYTHLFMALICAVVEYLKADCI